MGEPDEPNERWAERLDAFLETYGLYALHFDCDESRTLWPKGRFIRVGYSPRGAHAVVGMGSVIIHDPHPSREGLVSTDGFVLFLPFFDQPWFRP
jgi:hypothetical protein